MSDIEVSALYIYETEHVNLLREALKLVGPSPSMIAEKMGVNVGLVRNILVSDHGAGAAYIEMRREVGMALGEYENNLGEIATVFGVRRGVVQRWIDENQYLKDIFDDTLESRTDTAEQKLFERIKLGDMEAIKMELTSSRGRKRGYGTKNDTVDVASELARLGIGQSDITLHIRNRYLTVDQAGEKRVEAQSSNDNMIDSYSQSDESVTSL